VSFSRADAEALPYRDATFDAALSSMVFAFLPHQTRALREMARVVRPGGRVAVAAHGRSFYHEAIEAAFRAVPKRYVIGYRVEFWPRSERAIRRAFERAGLADAEIKRVTWAETHSSPADAYRFFSGTGGTWWLSKFSDPRTRESLSRRVRDYFERNRITRITQDVVFAYGVRPPVR
jgi:ubiquinone/menaquinone biosynthesis C-methylase UbiE